ncbi:uncharacterized protein LOC143252978 isoform X2 [Tachypleus tridentatus]|uniref:uncharacterized protein LOC143252978 isoform X2 n=1 Tax=Tachypleus tridentatus TaxID=6853 RepID=UPI003FCF0ABD
MNFTKFTLTFFRMFGTDSLAALCHKTPNQPTNQSTSDLKMASDWKILFLKGYSPYSVLKVTNSIHSKLFQSLIEDGLSNENQHHDSTSSDSAFGDFAKMLMGKRDSYTKNGYDLENSTIPKTQCYEPVSVSLQNNISGNHSLELRTSEPSSVMTSLNGIESSELLKYRPGLENFSTVPAKESSTVSANGFFTSDSRFLPKNIAVRSSIGQGQFERCRKYEVEKCYETTHPLVNKDLFTASHELTPQENKRDNIAFTDKLDMPDAHTCPRETVLKQNYFLKEETAIAMKSGYSTQSFLASLPSGTPTSVPNSSLRSGKSNVSTEKELLVFTKSDSNTNNSSDKYEEIINMQQGNNKYNTKYIETRTSFSGYPGFRNVAPLVKNNFQAFKNTSAIWTANQNLHMPSSVYGTKREKNKIESVLHGISMHQLSVDSKIVKSAVEKEMLGFTCSNNGILPTLGNKKENSHSNSAKTQLTEISLQRNELDKEERVTDDKFDLKAGNVVDLHILQAAGHLDCISKENSSYSISSSEFSEECSVSDKPAHLNLQKVWTNNQMSQLNQSEFQSPILMKSNNTLELKHPQNPEGSIIKDLLLKTRNSKFSLGTENSESSITQFHVLNTQRIFRCNSCNAVFSKESNLFAHETSNLECIDTTSDVLFPKQGSDFYSCSSSSNFLNQDPKKIGAEFTDKEYEEYQSILNSNNYLASPKHQTSFSLIQKTPPKKRKFPEQLLDLSYDNPESNQQECQEYEKNKINDRVNHNTNDILKSNTQARLKTMKDNLLFDKEQAMTNSEILMPPVFEEARSPLASVQTAENLVLSSVETSAEVAVSKASDSSTVSTSCCIVKDWQRNIKVTKQDESNTLLSALHFNKLTPKISENLNRKSVIAFPDKLLEVVSPMHHSSLKRSDNSKKQSLFTSNVPSLHCQQDHVITSNEFADHKAINTESSVMGEPFKLQSLVSHSGNTSEKGMFFSRLEQSPSLILLSPSTSDSTNGTILECQDKPGMGALTEPLECSDTENSNSSISDIPTSFKPVELSNYGKRKRVSTNLEDVENDKVSKVNLKRPTSLPLKKKRVTACMIGSTLISPETPRPRKSCIQQYINGQAYTYLGLKCSTRSTFCCSYRPQPMYVPQDTDPKLSMYCNWQAVPVKNKILNLTPGQHMGLYDSRQWLLEQKIIMSQSLSFQQLINTHSSYWMYSMQKQLNTEKCHANKPFKLDQSNHERQDEVNTSISDDSKANTEKNNNNWRKNKIVAAKEVTAECCLPKVRRDVEAACIETENIIKQNDREIQTIENQKVQSQGASSSAEFITGNIPAGSSQMDKNITKKNTCEVLFQNKSAQKVQKPNSDQLILFSANNCKSLPSCDFPREFEVPFSDDSILSQEYQPLARNFSGGEHHSHSLSLEYDSTSPVIDHQIWDESLLAEQPMDLRITRNIYPVPEINNKVSNELNTTVEDHPLECQNSTKINIHKTSDEKIAVNSSKAQEVEQRLEINDNQQNNFKTCTTLRSSNCKSLAISEKTSSILVPTESSKCRPCIENHSHVKSSKMHEEFVVARSTQGNSFDEGKSVCEICHKSFRKPSMLRLHLNIHYFERRFRCDSCSLSFHTIGHLQKHKRSLSHNNKLNRNLTFGSVTADNPRPFKCSDCKIAFRIHGHLAKHLRSKMHIMKLECLGKLPFGLYAEIERSGVNVNEIDTTDCANSLESLQVMAQRLYRQEPDNLHWDTASFSSSEEEDCRQSPACTVFSEVQAVSCSDSLVSTAVQSLVLNQKLMSSKSEVKIEPQDNEPITISKQFNNSGQKALICQICQLLFNNTEEIKKHMFSSHHIVVGGTETFIHLLQSKSSKSEELDVNSYFPGSSSKISCSMYDKTFSSQETLQNHVSVSRTQHKQPLDYTDTSCAGCS